ncbi:hypothetical protein D3C84_921300 [compost metagenome]
MGTTKIFCADAPVVVANGGAQVTRINAPRNFVEDVVLLLHVLCLVKRAGVHQLPVQRQALALERYGVQRGRVIDQAQLALRLQ